MTHRDVKDKHCYNCGKTFARPALLLKHKNRKTPCLIQEVPEDDKELHRCKFCNRAYKHNFTLTRHYKVCKIKNGGMEILMRKVSKEQENEQKDMIQQMMDMMKSQQEKMKKMEKTIETLTITNTIQGNHNIIDNSTKQITNQITNQVIINNYMTPNVKGLVLKQNTIDSYSTLSCAVLDHIWFNPERPENHSFYVSNKKEKELMVYTINPNPNSSDLCELEMKWKMLTTDKDRELFVRDLQNTIIKEGINVVNGMYNNDTKHFEELPKDLRDRIVNFNGGERLAEKEVLQLALKGTKMLNTIV